MPWKGNNHTLRFIIFTKCTKLYSKLLWNLQSIQVLKSNLRFTWIEKYRSIQIVTILILQKNRFYYKKTYSNWCKFIYLDMGTEWRLFLFKSVRSSNSGFCKKYFFNWSVFSEKDSCFSEDTSEFNFIKYKSEPKCQKFPLAIY